MTVNDDSHNHTIANVDNLQTTLDAKADLVSGVIPTSQLPALAVTEFLGTVSSQTAMLALTGQKGDWCNRTDVSSTFIITGTDPTQLSNWTELDYPAADVTSVNTQTGAVVLSASDIGLGNVDNTSDLNKPISTATQTALNGKLGSTDNAASASQWNTARTITLGGDLSGSVSIDGSSHVTLIGQVADDSHNHIIANVDGLQAALDAKLGHSGKASDSELLDGINSTSFLRSDTNNSFTSTITGNTLLLGGSQITQSTAVLQVNGFSRQGTIYLHDLTNGVNSQLSNSNGTLQWGGNQIWTAANDGSGSTLDADLLDGFQGSSYMRSDAVEQFDGQVSGRTFRFRCPDGRNAGSSGGSLFPLEIYQNSNVANSDAAMAFHISGRYATYFGIDRETNDLFTGGWSDGSTKHKIWHAGNDGASSGLDADLLDGIQGSSFMRSDASTSTTGNLTVDGVVFSNELRNRTGQQLVLNAGEAAGKFTGQTGELVYLNAEAGILVSTPDTGHSNFESGYTQDSTRITGTYITIDGNTVWHAGNDGAASGLDADLLDGAQPSVNASNSTIVQRHSSGYIYANYFNTTPNDVTSGITKICCETGNDGFIRHATPDAVKGFIGATAGATANTVVSRDGAADIACRLLRPNYGNESTISGAIAYRVNTSSNNYVRFCNDAGAVRTFLGAAPSASPTFSGNLTIPSAIVHSGDSNTYIQFHGNDLFRVVIAGAEVQEWGNNYTLLSDNDQIRLGTGSDFRMWFNGADTYFRNYAHGNGDIIFQGENSSGTNQNLAIMKCDSARNYVILYENSQERLRTTSGGISVTGALTATGNVTAFSDIKLKDDIKVIPNALDKVSKIRGVTFIRKDIDDKSRQAGVIAQEVEKVIPEVVTTTEDGIKTVAYGNLVGLLIESIKELKKEVEELKGASN